MDLEDIRIIVLDERESGKLTAIPPDIFEKAKHRLSELYEEAKCIDNFLTGRGTDLVQETESIKVTLNDIARERFKKILKIAINQMEIRYVDPQELRKMLPEEREMYEDIAAAISRCREELIIGTVHSSNEQPPVAVVEKGSVLLDAAEEASRRSEMSEEYEIVRILEDIEPFMGTDGRIYSLIKEDIVTLPEKNAQVLYERNIALSIKAGK
ncbi:MAG TPA: DNA replication complex GINS family protein [Deltaproteobacteria bacterium]|nr:DNA replication complex GINS family protein [Deltaproteobacteria bacterium]